MTRLRNESMIDRAAIMSKALGEPQRMKIMKILGSSDGSTYNVCDIAQLLGLSQSTTTKHLKVLYDAGFVTRTRNNTSVFYRVNLEGLAEYREVIECGFLARTTPCVNGYDCETCAASSTCNTSFEWTT